MGMNGEKIVGNIVVRHPRERVLAEKIQAPVFHAIANGLFTGLGLEDLVATVSTNPHSGSQCRWMAL